MTDLEKGTISLPGFLSVEDSMIALEIIFLLAVTIAAIFPRMPLDTPWEIGGNLSKPFRYLLLAIFITHCVRNSVGWPYFIAADAVETIMLSCLYLMTPYLLRVWLSDRINIGRRSGQLFTRWVQVVAVLSFIGAFLRVTVDRKYWVFTKIADALSFVPVTQTLTLYNSVTHSGTRYPGRGSVLSQLAVVVEWFSLLAHTADGASKILGLLGLVHVTQLNSTTSPTMKTVYHAIRFLTFLRVLCHSILLNSLDEAYTIGSVATNYHSASQEEGGKEDDDSYDEEDNFCGVSKPGSTRQRQEPMQPPLVETVFEDEEEGMTALD